MLTTNPSSFKVQILNGSGAQGIAAQAAAGLTSRGFDVAGTGNAPNFAYTNSVIEYPSTAEMAAVNTLKKELTNVTDLLDPTLAPGTVDLILGSDFAGLVPLAPGASPSPTVSASPHGPGVALRLAQSQSLRVGQRPGRLQRRHHRGGQLRQRQLGVLRTAEPLSRATATGWR